MVNIMNYCTIMSVKIISVKIVEGKDLCSTWRSKMQVVFTDKGTFVDNLPNRQFGCFYLGERGYDWKNLIGKIVHNVIIIKSRGKDWINYTAGSYVIEDFSLYAVGDIILMDGRRISVTSISSYEKSVSNPPVAVIAGVINGIPIALGLRRASCSLMWAKVGTTGYDTNFKSLIVKYSRVLDSYEFDGNIDGSDNWKNICSVDSSCSEDIIKSDADIIKSNYPIFIFAQSYGKKQDYTNEFSSGWYIPSIAELYEIYKNRNVIQSTFIKTGGFILDPDSYWSCTQSFNYCSFACALDFSNGYIYDYGKSGINKVLVIRKVI